VAYLELRNLWKWYGSAVGVEDVSLEIEKAEFVSLLGPSGCGKTTTLRLVAGLCSPDEGEIILEGEPITRTPVPKRGMGMVFQTWALFPNMSVEQNIGFPLKVQKASGSEIARRVKEIIELVGLRGLEKRHPHQLSGGQQQRVALGRAIARNPRVLLLDEPLSALDAPIRKLLIVEIRRLQQQLGMTTLYVTHDQEEALSMSDRVAVMSQGRIVEIGTPEVLYNSPQSAFAASFIGATNILTGEVIDAERALIRVDQMELQAKDIPIPGAVKGQKVKVSVRPEDIRCHRGSCAEAAHGARAKVVVKYFLGATTRINVSCGNVQLRIDLPSASANPVAGGEDVCLHFDTPCRILEVIRG
jgi:putative spermidine/putrescine transport system ATP-binding protein